MRRRICYVDGFPVGDPEIVFNSATLMSRRRLRFDVRPKIAGAYRIKFKAEALPLKDQVGGYRILYSHNCQFGLSQMHEADRTSMATLVRVFPALAAAIKVAPDRENNPSERRHCGRGIASTWSTGLW